MKKILVTGGAGFIGSNLIKKLLKTGQYQITCFDNFDNFYPWKNKTNNLKSIWLDKNFNLIIGDIRKEDDLNKIGDIDILIHLAAKAGVRESIIDPLTFMDVNIGGTQKVLDFAKCRCPEKLIFASSSSVYGLNMQIPWKEESALFPISPYACTKAAGEMLGHTFAHLNGISFVALRFFTVYGPGQRPDLAIHKFFSSIMSSRPLPLFGLGDSVRNYTYIDDITAGIEATINYTGSLYEIINIGGSTSITLSDLIVEIEKVCNKKAIINNLAEQAGDVPVTFADISKARKLLGYEPKVSLKVGLQLFYNWIGTLDNKFLYH